MKKIIISILVILTFALTGCSNSKQADPKQADPNKTETNQTDTNKAETNQADTNKAEINQTGSLTEIDQTGTSEGKEEEDEQMQIQDSQDPGDGQDFEGIRSNDKDIDQDSDIKNQIYIIADHRELWNNLLDYANETCQYTLTDLDQNGRIELIVSQWGGTGYYTYSEYYEVNDTYDGLIKCFKNYKEGDSQADIMVDTVDSYFDKSTDTNYYIFMDYIKISPAEYYEGIRSLSLKNGKITEIPLVNKTTTYEDDDKSTTRYTDSEGLEITEDVYLQVVEKRYGDFEKKKITFSWYDLRELDSLTKDELSKKLQEVYEEIYGESVNSLTN